MTCTLRFHEVAHALAVCHFGAIRFALSKHSSSHRERVQFQNLWRRTCALATKVLRDARCLRLKFHELAGRQSIMIEENAEAASLCETPSSKLFDRGRRANEDEHLVKSICPKSKKMLSRKAKLYARKERRPVNVEVCNVNIRDLHCRCIYLLKYRGEKRK